MRKLISIAGTLVILLCAISAWAASGDIVTIAGNGTSGFSGDGGPATSASLYGPAGVTVDAAGNIYIADTCNYRIRKVDASTGSITTVAGNGTTSGHSGPHPQG